MTVFVADLAYLVQPLDPALCMGASTWGFTREMCGFFYSPFLGSALFLLSLLFPFAFAALQASFLWGLCLRPNHRAETGKEPSHGRFAASSISP